MADTGQKLPNNTKEDDSIGSVEWLKESNIKADDGSHAETYYFGYSPMYDYDVRLYNNGTIGNNKAKGNATSSSFEKWTYGGSNDTWGASLSPSDINSADFGLAVSYKNDSDTPEKTYYLVGYDFGFSIPSGATIDGIEAEIRQRHETGGSGAEEVAVDYYKLTVYYSEGGGGGGGTKSQSIIIS